MNDSQTRADLDALIRAAGAVIDPPRVKGWYAPYRDAQPTDGVAVRRDIAYGSDERQKLDVYLPTSPSDTPRPVLVFVHGGGFIRGNRSERANVGWRFARAGFVTVLPSYRLGPAHRWPAGAQDVAATWAWAHANAAALGADPARIVIAGESAGAAHAAAATLIARLRPAGLAAPKAAIFISGVYNVHLEKRARRQFKVATPDPRNEAYFGDDFDRYPEMSTVEQIDVPAFPVLVTWAELDPPQMHVQAGELFARLTTQYGFDPDLAVIPAHNHLSQLEAINTVDDVLASAMLDFLNRV
ncbi:alpha/beta hydrolase [Pararobbsia silviterrae]|uniref:Alpha/beta hydrolase n=1 Tax=Pararobbsia silviterrae TaxID=1792498 RepID=A0A494X2A1_9BURK|nr:alpha/beta hydrolase [Pararobbsia silviterrae]RKP44460.1 alpha/beta hydrolase [Pararobbsia silviterrae]